MSRIILRISVFLHSTLWRSRQKSIACALTLLTEYDRMVLYAGMVELVDSVDLGAVTLVKVFHFVIRTEKLNTRA